MEENTLNEIANKFLTIYKQLLLGVNKQASGQLINQATTKTEWQGDKFIVYLVVPEHYKYVEEGRKPGTFPNIDAIKEWIRVKPILPTPYNGKLPTENQLAFLIGRKIKEKGIEPTPRIETALKESNIANLLSEEIIKNFNKQINDLWQL